MSLIWKIGLYERQDDGFAWCKICKKPLKLTDRSPNNLFSHINQHPEYKKKLKELQEKEKAQKDSMYKFVQVQGSGGLTSLDKKVLHHIACQNLPFSIVESQTFKALLSSEDKEKLKGRDHYSRIVLPRMYSQVKVKIQKLLRACPFLSFTSDIWSGPTESFISLTAHGIDAEWNRVNYILCIRHFPGSHNFETIGKKVNDMLHMWNIPLEKCHLFLRDEGSSMKKAFETEGFNHADCGAHKLNINVQKSLFSDKKIEAMLEKSRALVGHFHHSDLAKGLLKEEQKLLKLPLHELIQDVKIRWNATYYMCERLCEQRKAIELYLTRHNKRKLELSEDEWELMSKLIKLLEPVEAASRQMCCDSATLSLQFPIARMLYTNIISLQEPDIETMKEQLLASIMNKFEVEDQRNYGMATFLDPRFKDRFSHDKSKLMKKVIEWLSEESAECNNNIVNDDEPAPKRQKTSRNSFLSRNSQFFDDEERSDQDLTNINVEIAAYTKSKCIGPDDDPLLFWKVIFIMVL